MYVALVLLSVGKSDWWCVHAGAGGSLGHLQLPWASPSTCGSQDPSALTVSTLLGLWALLWLLGKLPLLPQTTHAHRQGTRPGMQHLGVHLTAAVTSLLIHPVPVHYPVTVAPPVRSYAIVGPVLLFI